MTKLSVKPILVLIISSILFFQNCKNKPEQNKSEKPPSKSQIRNDSLIKAFDQKDADEKAYRLDSLFSDLFVKGIFNGNVLISQNGKVIYKGSFGYKNLNSKEELKIDTPFQLASVSKQFTAVAIMQLKEKGLLRYNDPVWKHVPNFPFDSSITIFSLLTHSSGIPNYIYCLDKVYDKSKPLTNKLVVDLIGEYKPGINYLPNARFNYNNSNYMYLAYIVEKLSGMSFRNYAQKYLFDPFGVIHAGNSYANGLIDRNSYQGKTKEQGLNRIDLGFRTINPTTGIFDRADPLAEMTPDFSPFSYTLNNPVNFIDEFGLSGSGWNTRGRQETEAETANKEQMQQSENRSFIQGGYRDVMTQSGSGKVGGANNDKGNESWTQKAKDFATGFSNGFGQLMHDLAPIRMADENDPKSLAESFGNLKNIPSNLIKLPSQLNNVYQNGNLEQKTQASVQAIGAIFAMAKGKGGNPNGLMLSKIGVHGNSLKSLKATWGYKLFSSDGTTFLKNGITSKINPKARYTKAFMSDKIMVPFKQFKNRMDAYNWEHQQNIILRGTLNKNMH